MKKVLQFQIKDCFLAFLLFTAIYMAVLPLFMIFSSFLHIRSNIGSMETASYFFIFVVGICMFSDNFPLFMQNGVSRKNIYSGSSLAFLLISAVFCIILSAYSELLKFIYPDRVAPIFEYAYQGFIDQHGNVISVLTGILFNFMFLLFFIAFGYMLGVLYRRAKKAGKILICAGLPIFLFAVFPMFIQLFSGLKDFISKIVSYFANGTAPFRLILLMAVLSVIASAVSFIAIRRAEI